MQKELQSIIDNSELTQEFLSKLRDKVKRFKEAGEVDAEDMTEPQRQKIDYKDTRRDKLQKKKFQSWVDQVEESSGFKYDELANKELTPGQMEEALLQAQIQARPTTKPVRTRGTTKFSVDPITGEKTRYHDKNKQKQSKNQRKRERATRFFDNL